jgi:flagellar transcriptional activator FlhD
MTSEELATEIREANLTYLMLAQNLIRADRAQAQFRLGMSEEAITLIAQLSPAQLLKVSSTTTLLCKFRVDEDAIWALLTNHSAPRKVDNEATAKLHASILMAGRFAEAM